MEIKMMQGDCLERMKKITDESVDMILCDLPYGCTHNKWDVRIDLGKLWPQYKRVIKNNGAIVLFADAKFSSELIQSNAKMFRYDIVWFKHRVTGFLNAKKMPMRQHELILVFYKKCPTYNPQFKKGKPYVDISGSGSSNYGKCRKYKNINSGFRYPTSIVDVPQIRKKGQHPTEKPVALLEYLIKTYTNDGETVLDNCMGSGSTGVACVNTNRNFIGIELDEKYFEHAKERIENAKREKDSTGGMWIEKRRA